LLKKFGNGFTWNCGSGNLLIKMEIITDFNQIDLNSLEEFIYNHPHGSFFQSTKAFKFFQSVDNYEPILLVAKKKDEIVGSLLAVVMKEKGLKGYFSRRCIVWGGPLVKDDHPEIVKAILQKLNELISNKVIYTEIRNLFDMSRYKKFFASENFKFLEYLNFILNIENSEKAFNNIKREKRRQIRKALNNSVIFQIVKKVEDFEKLYLILQRLYLEKVKKPFPSFNFFMRLFETDSVIVVGIYYNNILIGGSILPFYKETIYDWYRGGLDSEYKLYYPSSVAVWAGMKIGNQLGFKFFDFMGAGTPHQKYGVRDFKSQFGGIEVSYGRFLRINHPILYQIGKMGLKVLKVLK